MFLMIKCRQFITDSQLKIYHRLLRGTSGILCTIEGIDREVIYSILILQLWYKYFNPIFAKKKMYFRVLQKKKKTKRNNRVSLEPWSSNWQMQTSFHELYEQPFQEKENHFSTLCNLQYSTQWAQYSMVQYNCDSCFADFQNFIQIAKYVRWQILDLTSTLHWFFHELMLLCVIWSLHLQQRNPSGVEIEAWKLLFFSKCNM